MRKCTGGLTNNEHDVAVPTEKRHFITEKAEHSNHGTHGPPKIPNAVQCRLYVRTRIRRSYSFSCLHESPELQLIAFSAVVNVVFREASKFGFIRTAYTTSCYLILLSRGSFFPPPIMGWEGQVQVGSLFSCTVYFASQAAVVEGRYRRDVRGIHGSVAGSHYYRTV